LHKITYLRPATLQVCAHRLDSGQGRATLQVLARAAWGRRGGGWHSSGFGGCVSRLGRGRPLFKSSIGVIRFPTSSRSVDWRRNRYSTDQTSVRTAEKRGGLSNWNKWRLQGKFSERRRRDGLRFRRRKSVARG